MKTLSISTFLFLLFGLPFTGFSDSAGPDSRSLLLDFKQPVAHEYAENIIWTTLGLMQLRKNQIGRFESVAFPIGLERVAQFQTIAAVLSLQHYDSSLFQAFFSFSKDGLEWGPWQQLEEGHEQRHLSSDSSLTSELMYLPTEERFFRILFQFSPNFSGQPAVRIRDFNIRFFTPADVAPVLPGDVHQHPFQITNDNCDCPLPAFAQRTDWNCPDGQDPSCSQPAFSVVTHQIVHHSYTPNTSSNWAATVLSIWDYHVNNNGWCDIGYNWVIDPNGVIYEGRGGGNNVRGAHFCAKNTGTMGICMLGTYVDTIPTQAALNSLKQLLTWKSCDSQLDPLASSYHNSSAAILPNISGHQDGCNTLCPGEELFKLLPGIRADVSDSLNACGGLTSSIDGQDWFTELSVFPNPNQGSFQLRINTLQAQTLHAQLFTYLGTVVWEEEWQHRGGEHDHFISLDEDLPTGMYLLQVQSPLGTSLQKVLIQQ